MTEIRTVAELQELPEGTVLRTKGSEFGELKVNGWGMVGGSMLFWIEGWSSLPDAILWYGPLTVLYRPDMPPQAVLHERVQAALAFHDRHVRSGGRVETQCMCVGCKMARALGVEDGGRDG